MFMNNVWAFGCSYTEGFGYDNKFKYNGNTMIMTDEQKQYHWLPTLQRLLNTGYNNYGIINKGNCGAGMKNILYTLLNNLPFIKSGDIVILGSTLFGRQSYIQDVEEDTFHQSTITPQLVTDYLEGKYPDNVFFHDQSKEYNELIALYYMENSSHHSETGFDYLSIEGQFIKRTFRNLCNVLESTGVRCYRWDTSIWDYSESIKQWTNNLFEDDHWSPNGDTMIGRFFYWCMVNGYKYFSYELFKTCLNDTSFDLNDFEYTKFRDDLVIRPTLI